MKEFIANTNINLICQMQFKVTFINSFNPQDSSIGYYYYFHLTKSNLRLEKTNQLAQGHKNIKCIKWKSKISNSTSMAS